MGFPALGVVFLDISTYLVESGQFLWSGVVVEESYLSDIGNNDHYNSSDGKHDHDLAHVITPGGYRP